MVATVTESELDQEQLLKVEEFLRDFLPRLRRQPGVVEILHFSDLDSGHTTTVIVWDSEESVRGYRESELIGEPMAFEQRLGVSSRRTGPLAVTRID